MSDYVLTPCPPRKRCKVCEARLDHEFRDKPRASKAAKYRHQAEQWGRFAVTAMLQRNVGAAEEYATRAATYVGMMWEEEAKTVTAVTQAGPDRVARLAPRSRTNEFD